ncbi:MAG: hypothetical protein ACR2I0_13295 [Rhodoferax sp.]
MSANANAKPATQAAPTALTPDAQWQQRRAANLRLGLILGAVVLALFLLSIWKYRPL